MTKQECKDCGCLKSEHTTKLCKSCVEIYRDNYKEYQGTYVNSPDTYKSPWHGFKLDNLKYLEQIYESRIG